MDSYRPVVNRGAGSMVEDRIAALEARAATLEARVRELEHARPAPPPRPPARPAAPPRPRRDLEDVLGGRVLAWVGGLAVLAGLGFLLTIAISRGWIGEGARTALAGTLSLGLLATGIGLRGRVEAALAAAAVGIAGCFGTLVVAGNVYDLVPVAAALAGAFATGALATALAIRWRARAIGWLGLLGALLAPAALGALDGAGIVFLATAFAASVAVLAWQDWSGLAWAAFAAATLQWLWWLAAEDPSAGATVLALATFGLLTAALAFGLDARRARLHLTAAALVPLNAAILAAAGAASLDSRTWLAALAAAHVIAGAAATRTSRALALIAVSSGVALADLALPAYASGVPLALTWAMSALVFAALFGARRHAVVA